MKTMLPARIAFALIVVYCVAVAVLHAGKPLKVDTNLKDLSPQLTRDPDLQKAVAGLSNAIENRFILLVTGPDERDTSRAAEGLAESLSALEGVHAYAGSTTAAATMIDQLSAYRFNLLTDEQAQQLKSSSESQLVESATRRLYQLTDGVRILPVDQDPFGWFTDYALKIGEQNEQNSSTDQLPFTPVRVTLERGGLETTFQARLIEALNTAEEKIEKEFSEIEILHSGVFFFAADAARTAKKDIATIGVISVVFIVAILLLTFHSIRPLFLPFASIIVGIGFAFVFTYTLFGSIHVLTIVFGASLIGIVIDYSLHFFYCHSDQASILARKGLLSAMALSLVSSIVGYGALGLSDLVSLQHIAVFSCAGLIAAWISVLALAQPLMGNNIRINPNFLPPIVDAFSRLTSRMAGGKNIFTVLLVALLVYVGIGGIQGNDNPRAFFNPSETLLEEEKLVSNLSATIEPGQYFVVRGEDENQLHLRLKKLHSLVPNDAIISAFSWLPSPQEQQKNYQLQSTIYKPGGAIEKFLTSLGLEAEALQTAFSEDGGKLLLASDLFSNPNSSLPPLVTKQNSSVTAFALIRKAGEILSAETLTQNLQGVDYINIALLSEKALKEQRITALWFLGLAFLLIAAILILRYRQFRQLSMLLVPLFSVSATLVIMSHFGGGITLFHAMALFLVLGLGMDYVIFFSELHEEQNLTLQAVFLSAVTSLLSFGLLSFSTIPVVHAFGITVLTGNSLNLIGSMIYASTIKSPAVAQQH